MPVSFVDSNVILYQFSNDASKARRAETIMREGGVVSIQVLNEIASVARRKMGMEWHEIRSLSRTLSVLFKVIPIDENIHADGLELCERHGFALYDGMIVAAAIAAGCDRLWSEDMHDGLQIASQLTISNPFKVSL